MKKTILFSLFFLVVTFATAQVQRKPTPSGQADSALHDGKPDKAMASKREMARELGLTREQMKQLRSIREENKMKQEAIENNTSLSEVERKRQLRTLQQEQMQKNSKVLSPEQLEKMKAYRKDNRANKADRPGDN